MSHNPDLLPDNTHLGAVALRVRAIPEALAVWRDVVGLTVIADHGETVELGVDDRSLIVLRSEATVPLPAKARGLFHVAIHVASRLELARTAARFRASGLAHSGQDHLLSESLYISDADGNGIEVCFDTLGRGGPQMVNGEIRFIANDGTPHTGLEPLDLAGLIANNLSESDLVGGSLAAGAFVGHIHMRAKAPEELMTFYLDVLGFRSNIQSRAFGMFDVGTTVRRHMVAFNIWAGAALTEPPDNAAGLAHFTVNVPSPEVMAAVVSRLRVAGLRPTDTGSSVLCPDPEGNQVRIAIA